jgi:hypothetical protein
MTTRAAITIGILIGVGIYAAVSAFAEWLSTRRRRFTTARDYHRPCSGCTIRRTSHLGRVWVVQRSEELIARTARRLMRLRAGVDGSVDDLPA